MATVEVELRNYKRKNGLQPLVLRVTSGSKVSRKNTGLYIKEAEGMRTSIASAGSIRTGRSLTMHSMRCAGKPKA